MTLAVTVRETARRFGPRTAFVDPDGSRLSYEDLDARSDATAAGLAASGVAAGDVVALRLQSRSTYVVAYAACSKIGAITAGVNPRLAQPEQDAVVSLARPAMTLHSEDDVDALARSATKSPLPTDPDRPVALVFTSGTTGTPKGALFRERELTAVARIDTGGSWGDPRSSPAPMLASTQFAHVGFMTKLPWYLRLGTTTHILERWRASDALACVAEHRMPSIGGVAPQIALLLREDLESYDLTCVRSLVVGGAASPPALVREAIERFGATYSIRYSSTESGGCGTGTAPDADDDEALHTVGKPRGGIEIRIAGDDEVGEVWLRSPTTMARYWRDPEATAEVMAEGWLRSGDLGRIDDRGNLRLTGRTTEKFIRGGYNVYPAEVEAALSEHPLVADVAVVPVADDVMGERGVAHVVPAAGSRAPTLEDLREFLRSRIAAYKMPEGLRILDALPLTAMQKVDRRALIAHASTVDPAFLPLET